MIGGTAWALGSVTRQARRLTRSIELKAEPIAPKQVGRGSEMYYIISIEHHGIKHASLYQNQFGTL
jgi:hypothetical protein